MNELETQIQLVAELRAGAQKASEAKIAARVAWENENKALLDLASFTAKNVEDAEAVLRELTLKVYAETWNKSPAPGVGVREVTKLEYDAKVALIWATDHRMALKLDTSAFEKIAKASPLDFVQMRGEAQATIASDLSSYLQKGGVKKCS